MDRCPWAARALQEGPGRWTWDEGKPGSGVWAVAIQVGGRHLGLEHLRQGAEAQATEVPDRDVLLPSSNTSGTLLPHGHMHMLFLLPGKLFPQVYIWFVLSHTSCVCSGVFFESSPYHHV